MSSLISAVTESPGAVDSISSHPDRTFIERARIQCIYGDIGDCYAQGLTFATIPYALGSVGKVLGKGALRDIPNKGDGAVGLIFHPKVSHWL